MASDPSSPKPPLDRKAALQHAGRLLASRPRTAHELAHRLVGRGADEDVADATIARLRELRLVDDLDFARRWVEERAHKRGLEALRAELEHKGVPPDVIEEVLADAGVDEVERAKQVAAERLPRLAGLAVQTQAARLARLLASRGFSEDAVDAAVRSVLPPKGWD